MKYFFVICILLIIQYQGSGQVSIEKHVISSLGSVEATLGEPIMFTFEGSEISIHQGFHPNRIGGASTPVVELDDISIEVQVFPNPTIDKINIKLSDIPLGNKSFSVHDINGKLILKQKIYSPTSICDLSSLHAGKYGLLLRDDETSVFITWIIKID